MVRNGSMAWKRIIYRTQLFDRLPNKKTALLDGLEMLGSAGFLEVTLWPEGCAVSVR